ncbi:hypothetical protein BJ508DRAFT_42221 [Ascobolus immersus RN42]|uniref:Uncharacterized protein n=1 Tax=Ascobolus immersus RN42 TaxID=1160509 RepID=A0A3N4IDH1_ASCIM|nr:hypothetical protein BJ508DRAFT_42221 [Ascobolus immersus RN42]
MQKAPKNSSRSARVWNAHHRPLILKQIPHSTSAFHSIPPACQTRLLHLPPHPPKLATQIAMPWRASPNDPQAIMTFPPSKVRTKAANSRGTSPKQTSISPAEVPRHPDLLLREVRNSVIHEPMLHLPVFRRSPCSLTALACMTIILEELTTAIGKSKHGRGVAKSGRLRSWSFL